MKHWNVDVPVYLIFFNRPDTFKMVFEAVKKARPSKLFLACDGPRRGREDDVENIKACQQIASEIDWDCEVYKNYSTENLGCGMRMYSGINWAFEYVDRLIILEDDCVPNNDWFKFCEELLERYKDDDRIYMISGMNHLGVYDKTPNSYFFGPGCCWGWATWKRAWKNVEYNLTFLDDKYSMKCIEKTYPYYKNIYQIGLERKAILDQGKKLTAWTYQSGVAAALQNQLSIIPSVNLITNVGLTADSGHATNNIKKLPKRVQKYFNMPKHELKFPLKHPKYIVKDWMYDEMKTNKFKTNILTKMESYARRIIYMEKGDMKKYFKKLVNRNG